METEIQSKTGKKYFLKPNKNGGWKVAFFYWLSWPDNLVELIVNSHG